MLVCTYHTCVSVLVRAWCWCDLLGAIEKVYRTSHLTAYVTFCWSLWLGSPPGLTEGQSEGKRVRGPTSRGSFDPPGG